VDPLSGLSQITQILRKKLSERSSSRVGKNVDTPLSGFCAPSPPRTKPSAEEIKRKIGERIRNLSADDRRGKKGAQIFVELVLMWDFGEQLLRDPQFTELSKEVVNAMAENSTVWNHLQTLLEDIE
jgi:hypothetical protein